MRSASPLLRWPGPARPRSWAASHLIAYRSLLGEGHRAVLKKAWTRARGIARERPAPSGVGETTGAARKRVGSGLVARAECVCQADVIQQVLVDRISVGGSQDRC